MLLIGFGDKDGEKVQLSLDETNGDVELNGSTITAEAWTGLVARVLAVHRRIGAVEKPAPTPRPRVSTFIGANLERLNKMARGRMRRAPLLLRPFYDSVVTKEPLDGYSQF